MAMEGFQITDEMLAAVAEWRKLPVHAQIAEPCIPYLRRRFALSYAQGQAVLHQSYQRWVPLSDVRFDALVDPTGGRDDAMTLAAGEE